MSLSKALQILWSYSPFFLTQSLIIITSLVVLIRDYVLFVDKEARKKNREKFAFNKTEKKKVKPFGLILKPAFSIQILSDIVSIEMHRKQTRKDDK